MNRKPSCQLTKLSCSVAIQNSYSLSNVEWIAKVASKGGTTESVLKVFERGNLEQTFVEAVKAASDRALELGLSRPKIG